jgi:hypothetical protein
MIKKSLRSKTFVWLVFATLLLFNSCKTHDITGKYVFCPWNCHTLIINKDSTYKLEMEPEFGSSFEINGTWTQSGKYITLKPIIKPYLHYDSTNGNWYAMIDSIKAQPTFSLFQTKDTHYFIKWNKLIEDTKKDDANVSFIKSKSDSTINRKTIERSTKYLLRQIKKL